MGQHKCFASFKRSLKKLSKIKKVLDKNIALRCRATLPHIQFFKTRIYLQYLKQYDQKYGLIVLLDFLQ